MTDYAQLSQLPASPTRNLPPGPVQLRTEAVAPPANNPAVAAPETSTPAVDRSTATVPGETPFKPKGKISFPDQGNQLPNQGNQLPTPADEKAIPDFVKKMQADQEKVAGYRQDQDQSKDRLDAQVGDTDLSAPEAVKGAQAALDKLNLPPAERKEVQEKMAELMGKLPEAQKREAAIYLEELFSKRGEDLGAKKLGALIGQVATMADRPYDARIGDSKAFALSSLRDIAAPQSTFQGSTNACAAASIQAQLAITDPERYLAMADTLAQGKAFEGMEPNWSFSREAGRSSDTGRSISAKLMQNTIMEAGRDNEGRVLNSPSKPGVEDYDSTLLPGFVPVEEGVPMPGENLSMDEKARLSGGTDEMGAVSLRRKILPGTESTVLYHSGQVDGKPEYAASDDVVNVSKREQVERLRAANPSPSNPLMVNILHPESGLHSMTAIGADAEAVTLINTATGGIERIPLADFEQMVVAVYLPRQ